MYVISAVTYGYDGYDEKIPVCLADSEPTAKIIVDKLSEFVRALQKPDKSNANASKRIAEELTKPKEPKRADYPNVEAYASVFAHYIIAKEKYDTRKQEIIEEERKKAGVSLGRWEFLRDFMIKKYDFEYEPLMVPGELFFSVEGSHSLVAQ